VFFESCDKRTNWERIVSVMPASLFGEMDHHHMSNGGGNGGGNGLEDQRALQLALELSMLGLTDPSSMSNESSPVSHESAYFSSAVEDIRNLLPKKSQNMTECVPVPSSEHVAEIVGRQGK